MTETTQEQVETLGRPTAATGDARPWDNTAPWHPPVSLWRLYLLIFLSLGLYLPLWIMRFMEDLQAHREREIDPWRHAAGIVLPLAGWYVWHSTARRVAALSAQSGQRAARQVWTTSLFGIAVLAVFQAVLLGLFVPRHLIVDPGVALLVAASILPLPFLLLQRQVNAYKMTLGNPRWTSQPFKLSPGEVSFLAMVLGFAGYTLYANKDLLSRTLDRAKGETLLAGQVVRGESGLYQLTLPTAGWVRVGTDDIHKNSDLSLYGPTEGTYLVVYVKCHNETIDQRVRFRRGRKRDALGYLTIEERRVLLDEALVPISYTRYAGTRKGGPETSWVATVAEEDFLVEVISDTRGGEANQAAAEAFVMSLRLEEGVTSCKKS